MKKAVKLLSIFLIIFLTNIINVNADEIPKVYFEGNIKNMTSKKDERKITLRYESEYLNFEAYTKIKVQGSSSLEYDKKNYTINLYEDKGYKSKKKVDVGFGEQSKYCLKANWIDKTHSRNIVTAQIVSDIQDKYNLFKNSPNNGLIDGFPVEIYINDEFLGIYTWNIPKDSWMFNMDEDNPNHIVLSASAYTESNLFKKEATFKDWEVEAGPETKDTLKKFNRLIKFVMESTDEEFRNNFEEYLNLDATLNYYIMIEFAGLFDNTAKNMLMVTYDGNIWYPSLYDLDTSWGTNWQGTSLFDYKNLITDNNTSLLWNRFTKLFNNEIANRYFEIRESILTKDYVLKEFNSFYKKIPSESIKLEQKRWQNIPGYDLSQIEEFLNIRIPLVDNLMTSLYDIKPNVEIRYSTTKKTLGNVILSFVKNRNDIKIFANNKEINDNYKITKNGTYTFEYKDWQDNVIDTETINVNWIIPKYTILIGIGLLIVVLILLITKKEHKKKKTKKKNNKNKKKKKTKKKKK